jgi:transposase
MIYYVLVRMKTKTNRDFEALEQRRREGMRLLSQRVAQAEVARRLNVSPAAVCKWEARRKAHPGGAWKRRPQGKPPKLTARHKERLCRILQKGAQAHGFLNDLWTLPRIASVLEASCGVRLHPGHLWRVLGALGWSVQKPERRALQRDEAAIAHWKRHTWPALKKKPGAKGAPSSLSTKAG